MRVVIVAVLVGLLPTPALAGWFKKPCPKGPDGHCVKIPCEPFLVEMRSLAAARRAADDPGCPGHEQSSRLADLHQGNVDREAAKMDTACIRKAAAIMRPVASIDVRRSYENEAGRAVALVRYTNNTHRTLEDATISCSVVGGAGAVAVGQAVAAGPIPDGASREVRVMIDLAGAAFSCVRCDVTDER